jgi:LAGLIDADG endonuclease|uniref:Putative LAGLIDADG homing endonuclease n=1 Tax=Pseudopleurococcus sp. A SAG 2039 TaxID=908851 RepID=A0A1C7A1B0_9CHLO|nr:putative LAGLIDADG homing endonuclease [Pseudopleurococcus sp. A SAG 2039]
MKLTAEWIVGFVDGDGHFGISQTLNTDRFSFIVSQDQRSVHVLYELKTFFQCGSVHKAGKNMCEYKVSAKKQLIEIIIPFFEQHALKTEKRKTFEYMAQNCLNSMESKRQLNINTVDDKLTLDWLIGFIDAEGSFVCSLVNNQFIAQMIIGLDPKDSRILDKIKDFLGYGVRYAKTGTEVFQLSAQKDKYHFINTYVLTKGSKDRLRTHKRIGARKWSKLILFLQTDQHKTQLGWNKAYKKYLNFKKALQTGFLVEDRVRPALEEAE